MLKPSSGAARPVRGAPVLPFLLLALLTPSAALASHEEGLFLVDAQWARAPGTMVGPVDMNDHRVVRISVQSHGVGPLDGDVQVVRWQWGTPGTIVREPFTLAGGATRTFTLDAWLGTLDQEYAIVTPGPIHLCATLMQGGNYGWQEVCWRDWAGTPFPVEDLPEDPALPYEIW